MVNFTASSYEVEVNENSTIVGVQAFGDFRSPFLVNVTVSAEEMPERSTYINAHAHLAVFVCILFYKACYIFVQVVLSLRTPWKCCSRLALILLY